MRQALTRFIASAVLAAGGFRASLTTYPVIEQVKGTPMLPLRPDGLHGQVRYSLRAAALGGRRREIQEFPVPQFSGLPMSNKIAALPRTHSGMPVPYTTLYLEDDDPSVLRQRDGRLFLDCRCTFGQGRPQLGQPCPHRQRRCMAERRCVTCGRRLGATAELVFLGLARRTTDGAVDGEFVSVEPPAHADCAAFSAFACPHLVRHPERVIVGVTRAYTLWHQVQHLDEHGEATMRIVSPETAVPGGAVDLFVALVDRASASSITPLDHWLGAIAPKRWRDIYASRVMAKTAPVSGWTPPEPVTG